MRNSPAFDVLKHSRSEETPPGQCKTTLLLAEELSALHERHMHR